MVRQDLEKLARHFITLCGAGIQYDIISRLSLIRPGLSGFVARKYDFMNISITGTQAKRMCFAGNRILWYKVI